jgi:hypothetical protein
MRDPGGVIKVGGSRLSMSTSPIGMAPLRRTVLGWTAHGQGTNQPGYSMELSWSRLTRPSDTQFLLVNYTREGIVRSPVEQEWGVVRPGVMDRLHQTENYVVISAVVALVNIADQ